MTRQVAHMKWIDIPPVWLALAIFCTWAIAEIQPAFLRIEGAIVDLMAGVLIGGGILLMLLAVIRMRQHNTTIIPHMYAKSLVTSGIFAKTRNPIYLGDALVLAGIALRFEAPIALLLVPLFMLTITHRFIQSEENRLRQTFGDEFIGYCQKTRRWV